MLPRRLIGLSISHKKKMNIQIEELEKHNNFYFDLFINSFWKRWKSSKNGEKDQITIAKIDQQVKYMHFKSQWTIFAPFSHQLVKQMTFP